MSPIRLTQTVQKGGCAAKVAATELKEILGQVKFPTPHPELLVDGQYFDDAAIYQVNSELALVQTIDFFTPIVDSPVEFGKIAACNALSDVYAMGGRPMTALGVLAFPLATIEREVITAIMQGACDQLELAKTNLVGGHSIDDDTIKFGLAVTGYVHPQKMWTNRGARAGDRLILTKALGTGTLTAALKRSAVSEQEIAPALQSMAQLNNAIDYLSAESLAAIHSATDVTGFGLSGHAWQMSLASGRGLRIDFESLPRLPLAAEFLAKEFLTKAHGTNRTYTLDHLRGDVLSRPESLILHDPQTSGGLLLAVEATQAEQIVRELKPHFSAATVIGEVANTPPGIEFR